MTPKDTALEPQVTIEDLKHRAHDVKNKAVAEAKGAAEVIVGQEGQRTLFVIAGIVIVAASIAYYLGTRSARCAGIEDFLGE